MSRLEGSVALVTGASRGVGKGVALGLGEAGARVFITGRTLAPVDGMEGSLNQTVAEVRALGADCVALRCDHRDDEQARETFARVLENSGRLDILVNSVWGGYENMMENGEFTWPLPFWKQPQWRWDAMFGAGVRAAFVSTQLAAPVMIEAKSGLIANISYWAAQKYHGNAIYGAAKCATDRLTRDMATELEGSGVTVVSLYPGLVRTEKVMESAEFLDLSNSESPQFIGRAVAHLASDPNVLDKSGHVLVAATLARDYGFTDIDGKEPQPLTLESA